MEQVRRVRPWAARWRLWGDHALEAGLMFILFTGMGSLVALLLALVAAHLCPSAALAELFSVAALLVAMCLLYLMGRWKRLPGAAVGAALLLCVICHFCGPYAYFLPAALLSPWTGRGGA